MKEKYQKLLVIAILVLPNIILIPLMPASSPEEAAARGNIIYNLGSAAGAATVIFLFYMAVKQFLRRSTLPRKSIIPLSIVLAYVIYYGIVFFL